jgi:Pilus formation protein N terminal region
VRARKFLISIALAALCAEPTQAQDQKQETIQIRPGFTQFLRFDRPIETIAIGNPEIADATAQSDRTVLLSGKRAGDTNLILFDRNGNAFHEAIISVVGRPELGRVAVHSKAILHRYWAYQCNDTSCWRVKDEFEGPPPEEQQPSMPAALAPGAIPGPTAPALPFTRGAPQR